MYKMHLLLAQTLLLPLLLTHHQTPEAQPVPKKLPQQLCCNRCMCRFVEAPPRCCICKHQLA
jgi:hypothetical protein